MRDDSGCARGRRRRVCRRRCVSECVDVSIAGGGVEDAIGDGGCRVNKTARLICPRFRFRCFVKRVNVSIARADIDKPVRDDRIAVASRSLFSPQLCIVKRRNRTECAVCAAVFNPANPDGAFARCFKRSGPRVQLIDFCGKRADVEFSINDNRRCVHPIRGFERPHLFAGIGIERVNLVVSRAEIDSVSHRGRCISDGTACVKNPVDMPSFGIKRIQFAIS